MRAPTDPKIQTKKRSVPITFLNSTLALLMVMAGFAVQDILSARGTIGLSVFVSACVIVVNFLIIHFWRRFDLWGLSEKPLFFLIGLQWCWVFYVVAGFYVSEPLTVLAVAGVGIWIGVWRLVQSKQNLWIGTVLFSLFGTLAMGLSIWHGLEDWTLSASARLKDSPQPSLEPRMYQVSSSPEATRLQERGHGVESNKSWSYSGETGPAMWGVMGEDFKRCAEGVNQSPVDVPRHANLSGDWGSAKWSAESGEIIKEGESLRIDLTGNSAFLIRGRTYKSRQLFIHTPSEHHVSGLKYPMEVQLTLESQSGDVTALAAFVEIGAENAEFQKIVSKIKPGTNPRQPINDLQVSSLFPKDIAAYRYKGSMTTPPCAEGVAWSILKRPIELSDAQVSAFRKLLPSNARPIQPMGQRTFEVKSTPVAH